MWLSKSLNYILVWFPVLALVVLFGFIVARRAYRELPYFSVYVLSALLLGAARYAAFYLSRNLYFYVYWISELVAVVVVSLALYEVFLRRLFSRFHKVRFYRGLFVIVAVAVFILTILTVLQAPDKGKAFLIASRAYDFVRTAVLVFLVALMALMGRHWTRYDFGIALGFAVQAAVALLNAAVRTKLHYRPSVMDDVEVVSFSLSCLIWLITFWKPEKPAPALAIDQLDPETLHQARTAESMLKNWLSPGRSKQKGAGQ
jgi:hypothetical protein